MKLWSVVSACVAACILNAADDLRIDLLAECDLACNAVSEGVTGAPARWLKTHPLRRLVVTAPAGEEWKAYSVTFTPETDGTIQLIVMGNRKDQEIGYDKFTLSGGKLKNGDFEEIGRRSVPTGWILQPEALGSGGAFSGTYCVRTSHDKRVQQSIPVKGGGAVDPHLLRPAAPIVKSIVRLSVFFGIQLRTPADDRRFFAHFRNVAEDRRSHLCIRAAWRAPARKAVFPEEGNYGIFPLLLLK